jgi:hypothetical protein
MGGTECEASKHGETTGTQVMPKLLAKRRFAMKFAPGIEGAA